MNQEQIRNKIHAFIKEWQLTVISTIDTEHQKPESAVIAFSERENLELIFGTSNKSRKYANLQKNPHVSFVIGWDTERGTVQYEGVAKELSPSEKSEYIAQFSQKNPRSAKFMSKEDQRYFLVTPTWIRLLDMTATPNQMHELRF